MTNSILNHTDLKIISNNFLAEIEKSNKGDPTSLNFIVHQLSPTPLVKDDENFQVMVVGGSVFKKALVKKTAEGIKIIKIENAKNIYFENKNEFLDLIRNELYPGIESLALNFAYALKPILENGKLDGILLKITKEGKFNDLIGKQLGQEIENNVFTKINKKIKVAVANDTVCLLTSGLDRYQEEKLGGGIVGTGLNFAFFLGKHKLVNLGSENFDKFAQTRSGEKVDEKSSQPGAAIFEKEVAGGYLFKHFNLIIKEKNLSFPPIQSTEELNNISLGNVPVVSEIAKGLIKRSAQLVACQVAGITLFKKRNMVFVMEGSLFWKGNNYKKTVEETVRQLVPEYKVAFVEIENSAIIGAAKLIS